MADDVCASVAFALGDRVLGGGNAAGGMGMGMGADPQGKGNVEFPYVRAKGKVSEEHARAAAVVGGWHLLDPLKSAFRVHGVGTEKEKVLRDGQVEWLCMQMERVGRIYGLHAQRGDGVVVGGGGFVGGGGGVWERNSFEFPV